eukprot:CAMPEP_0174253576 /NCGR_PEP_ID=MMETSP0439-20130205/2943_1 /TAXON_ID=0 /ORGANISM="Stereomyxa ramosa, Strain Chinc5" /LENGTH=347 /DNA_ID=CAMNT_0015334677 /DNA_START=23 /DNA_END=1062 /DNA_ORIENTATION=-
MNTSTQTIQVQISFKQRGKRNDDCQDFLEKLVERKSSCPSFVARKKWISFEVKEKSGITSFFSDELFLESIERGVLKITLKRKPTSSPRGNTELQDKLALLESKGFTRRGQNVRLLNKFDGDMDKVMEALEARRAPTPCKRHSKFEEELAILTERGFTKRGKNFGLLHRFDGDVDEVIKVLEKLGKEKNPFDEQLAILADKGFTRRGRSLGLLHRFDGDVDEVVKFLQEKKCGGIDWQAKEEQYAAELAQLEEMGFDRKHKNLRLLHRFDGSVEEVTSFLLAKQHKRNSFHECTDKYKMHLNVLKDMGYTNQKRNLRLLTRFDGDLKQVVPVLDKTGNKPTFCKKQR